MNWLFAILLMVAVPAQAKAQAQAQAQTQTQPIPVVATFSILADLAAQVGGTRVKVTSLVGPGGDAHVFQPAPSDTRLLAQAQLIVENGLGFEGWIDRLVAASGTKAKIVVATKGIIPRQRAAGEDHAGQVDPHAWQSLSNAKIYVANIAEGLSAVDPDGRALYAAHALKLTAELDALEAEVRAAVAAIAPGQRRIITTHDAFGYFGAAYGLALVAPQGVSTEAEPSARDIGRIIRQIKLEKIPALFMENIKDQRLMAQISAATGAKIGGTLYSDSLSEPNGPAGTYILMVKHNIRVLTDALTAQR